MQENPVNYNSDYPKTGGFHYTIIIAMAYILYVHIEVSLSHDILPTLLTPKILCSIAHRGVEECCQENHR